ncbi:L-threonylcarbamoyladenylate synthase [Paenibacillus thalictri]|uniref:Threonylcarbamoyl-AMP synthase n=1 Tax=Paenibacillus thalictri TaxID=2527873 RepID=A0A4Q9DK05_9BACL|nr:L-threonylcarbamoyladenylate synthase [Paenibacillus thalictri]TBL72940.1 threonylcarbamoyl-AMP synthase [Paenibacillus thalictri]
MTIYWNVNPEAADPQAIREAAGMLRAGQTVAFPTETVYGLGADARSSEAVQRIFTAKGRPSDNPLIVHIAHRSQLDELASSEDETVSRLIETFWPGPLTIVLPLKPGALSPLVTAGLDTVGVRMPDHPVALALLEAAGCPVAAPSANRSGRPSPTRAEHVREDLAGRIGGLVDGGPTGVGLESTVVAVAPGEVHVLRPGGVTSAQLREAVPGAAIIDAAGEAKPDEAPRSPGMKYTHYAPQGRMLIVQGTPEAAAARIRQELAAARAAGERTGVLAFTEDAPQFAGDADCIVEWGGRHDAFELARRLYDALRRFDEEGVDFIAAQHVPDEGLGEAIMNRLRKAAGNRIVHV